MISNIASDHVIETGACTCQAHDCCSEESKSNHTVHLIQFIAFEYDCNFLVEINDSRCLYNVVYVVSLLMSH